MRTHQAWTTCWLSVCRLMENFSLEMGTAHSGAGCGATTRGCQTCPHSRRCPRPITTIPTWLQAQMRWWRTFIKLVNAAIVSLPQSSKLACRSLCIWFCLSTETMLPCEFCEELFPEEDLILHQVREETFFGTFCSLRSRTCDARCLFESASLF